MRNMVKTKKYGFFIFMLLIICCEKDKFQDIPKGAFLLTNIIQTSPIRCFTKSGEIIDSITINQILSEYNNYVPNSWGGSQLFTEIDFVEDSFIIYSTYAESNILGDIHKYDFGKIQNTYSLESQDTIVIDMYFSEEQIQIFKNFSLYPIPNYLYKIVPTRTGFKTILKFKDIKYFVVIDKNTVRFHYTRYLLMNHYNTEYNKYFWLLPITLNNALNKNGYTILKDDAALLIKEFELEYTRK